MSKLAGLLDRARAIIGGTCHRPIPAVEAAVLCAEASIEVAAQLERIANALEQLGSHAEKIAEAMGNLDVTAHNHAMGATR